MLLALCPQEHTLRRCLPALLAAKKGRRRRVEPGRWDRLRQVMRIARPLVGQAPGKRRLRLTDRRDEAVRVEKRTNFGSVMDVFPKTLMPAMRAQLTACLARDLPAARIRYWT